MPVCADSGKRVCADSLHSSRRLTGRLSRLGAVRPRFPARLAHSRPGAERPVSSTERILFAQKHWRGPRHRCPDPRPRRALHVSPAGCRLCACRTACVGCSRTPDFRARTTPHRQAPLRPGSLPEIQLRHTKSLTLLRSLTYFFFETFKSSASIISLTCVSGFSQFVRVTRKDDWSQ